MSSLIDRIPADLSRRDFMKLLGASAALAGASGCVREPSEKILPYVSNPAHVLPGVASRYATAMTLDGFATGLLVESRDGRPVKIEGNPAHPASCGAAGIFEQASLLQLYDPHRLQSCLHGGRGVPWTALVAAFSPDAMRQHAGSRGAGLRLLLEPTSSPQMAALLERIRTNWPEAGVHYYAANEHAAALDATRAAFGTPLLAQHDLRSAEVIVALDADLFAEGPCHLRYARDFSRRGSTRAHLHVVETAPSPTGTLGHRLAAPPALISAVALELLQQVTTGTGSPPTAATSVAGPLLPADAAEWVATVAAELLHHRGRSVVIAGPRQTRDVHLATIAINAALANAGQTVWYAPSPVLEAGEASHSVEQLADALANGAVDTLIITATNPCYAAPADARLASRIKAIRQTLYLGEYIDETARIAGWCAPAAHYLESWADTRAFDGTISPVQPLIAPMYDGRTPAELLATLLGDGRSSRALLEALQPASTDDAALGTGMIEGSAFARQTPAFRPESLATFASTGPASSFAVVFAPGRGVYDGRFAANAWLQELPDPVTRLTWGNAALLSPGLATRLAVATGDVVRLQNGGASIDIPVLITPGHADHAITLPLGYGRNGIGILEDRIGVDVNPLRLSAAPFVIATATAARTGASDVLALTQRHWSIEGRQHDITSAPRPVTPAPQSLYHAPAHGLDGFGADQWAMTIDLDLCTGCSACVVACQAENNIPVVGKAGVLESREMHWIRIDRYVDGPAERPAVTNQPMLCQHCEDAPCEYVCPVNATVHSDDGLNEMVYNRCVGTRFCSNNCPYKVRRFNWLNYHEGETPVDALLRNPDVTVRARGVMEKCTFCVQRLRHAQRDAQIAGAPRTGPVMTACQQACPTQAIVFGSLTNPADPVVETFHDSRSFAALESLRTRPRVRYLARQPDKIG